MRNRYFFKALFIALMLTIAQSGFVSAEVALPSPKVEITSTIDEIVNTVESLPSESQVTQRREQLRTIINPKFDFAKMAQLSLGTHWNEITPDERAEFVTIFSNLLAKTYLAKIETVKRGMVSIETESLDSETKKAIVKTLVTNKGDTFPIDYRLSAESGGWKVYDVVIENIGLVVNYRNEFAGIIRKEKFSGLLQKLKDKSAS